MADLKALWFKLDQCAQTRGARIRRAVTYLGIVFSLSLCVTIANSTAMAFETTEHAGDQKLQTKVNREYKEQQKNIAGSIQGRTSTTTKPTSSGSPQPKG
jgi:hypothetical protein